MHYSYTDLQCQQDMLCKKTGLEMATGDLPVCIHSLQAQLDTLSFTFANDTFLSLDSIKCKAIAQRYGKLTWVINPDKFPYALCL